ncbi:MAG: RlmE family RNA methyltransferase [Hyphomicrobiaceae bacterium]|nr:RlmE family RNA methyltransferase [Hyphomicrobiaceae bacterium]
MARQPGGGGKRQLKVRVKTARGRRTSSQMWLERQLNDPYVAEARSRGYRSRAAFKLIEMDDKWKLMRPGDCVIDLGAAPGGWTQVAVQRTKAVAEGATAADGQVIAIDISAMEQIPGAEIIHLDFMDETAADRLKALMRKPAADLVMSDMAAPATGHTRTDHLRIMGLAEAAAEFAGEVLRQGGAFLCKVLQGGTERELLDRLKREFTTVRHVKPPASRADSSELYVLATGFRGGNAKS